MKKLTHQKSIIRSILSLLTLGLFLVLALGSVDTFLIEMLGFEGVHKYSSITGEHEFGIWKGAKDYADAPIKIGGLLDENGLLHGDVSTIITNPDGGDPLEIWSHYSHGYLIGARYFYTNAYGEKVSRTFYYDHQLAEEESTIKGSLAASSGFEQLSGHYGWRLDYLDALGFSPGYVENYMDTIEVLLADYSFEVEDFDDYYEDVLDILAETPYDSIIEMNSFLSGIRGLDLIKRLEFRMAVLDHSRDLGTSTFDVISSTYPGILAMLAEEELSPGDFEVFCDDLDDSLAVYEPLDVEDPFFIDSVDTRFYRAIMGIYYSGEESLKKSPGIEAANWDHLFQKPERISASPATSSPEFAEMILYTILMEYIEGYVIKRSCYEAFLKQEGVVSLPTVATQLLESITVSSASLEGYVLENGGAEVSSRGMAWATFHNPTVENNTESQGTGTGKFTVSLNGLTEGKSYYARAYATNSAGTVYGNCIKFVPGNTLGIEEDIFSGKDFDIYPNPAASYTTLEFQLKTAETVNISILDMSGRTVYQNISTLLSSGKHRIIIDISELPDGVYYCQLWSRDRRKTAQKLVIAN